MNEEIGSYDAKTKLSEILRRVEAVITYLSVARSSQQENNWQHTTVRSTTPLSW